MFSNVNYFLTVDISNRDNVQASNQFITEGQFNYSDQSYEWAAHVSWIYLNISIINLFVCQLLTYLKLNLCLCRICHNFIASEEALITTYYSILCLEF